MDSSCFDSCKEGGSGPTLSAEEQRAFLEKLRGEPSPSDSNYSSITHSSGFPAQKVHTRASQSLLFGNSKKRSYAEAMGCPGSSSVKQAFAMTQSQTQGPDHDSSSAEQ